MKFGNNNSGNASQPQHSSGGRPVSSGSGGKGNQNSGSSRSLSQRDLKGNIWIFAAIGFAVLVALGVFIILNQLTATSTYYVLNQNIPARTQVTPAMMQEVVVTAGGQPRNALTVGDINNEPTFSKFSLNAGDIITLSNTGPLTDINEDIPDNYTVASFSAPAERSVAGKLQRGNYIDIIAVNSDQAAFVLRRVLILDASAGATSATETSGAAPGIVGGGGNDQEAAVGGVPTLYTVALTPEDAAVLALVQDLNLLVVLSPNKFEDSPVVPEAIQQQLGDLFAGREVGDSGEGTDPTFGAGETDENLVTNNNSQSSGQETQPPAEEPAAPEVVETDPNVETGTETP